MTGRQSGYGAGFNSPGFTRAPGMGRRQGFFGRGRSFGGLGRGFRFFRRGDSLNNDTPQSLTKTDEITGIKTAIQDIRNSLASITDRLNLIDSGNKEK
jgi:hypothetical protein